MIISIKLQRKGQAFDDPLDEGHVTPTYFGLVLVRDVVAVELDEAVEHFEHLPCEFVEELAWLGWFCV